MNKQNALARSLSLLAVALILFTSFACLLAPSEVAPTTDTGAVTVQSNTAGDSAAVLNEHAYSYSTPDDVRDIATGDLNGDDIADILVASGTHITIYYRNADGSLGNSYTIPLDMNDIRRIAVGDLDNDGLDDIAVTYMDATGNSYASVFFQNDTFSTSGMFKIMTFADPWQIVIGNFCNSTTNGFAVICRGNPSKSEPARLLIIRMPYIDRGNEVSVTLSGLNNLELLTAGYVNSDGFIDLVVGDVYGRTIISLTQPAAWGDAWPSNSIDVGGSIADVQFMDYLGSGKNRDLAIAKYGLVSNQIEIHINDGSIPISASVFLTFVGTSSLAVGSVTGTSSTDLLALSSSGSQAKYYSHQASGLDSNKYYQFPVNTGPIKAVILNGGAYVLSPGSSHATVEFYPYAGSSIGNADANRFTPDGQPTVTCAGDVSFGIVAAAYSGQNAVYVSSSSGASRVISTTSAPTSLYIGDIDGDGIGDLAIGFLTSNIVLIYKGSSGFMSNNQPVTISIPRTQTYSLTGGWIEAINKNVLVVGCSDGIDVIYDALSGSPTHETIEATGPWVDVGFGRLNSAGTDGCIAALSVSSKVEIYYVKQSPSIGDCYDSTYNAKLSGFTPYSTPTLAVGDFDGNGRDDVAVTATSNQVKIFSNTGTGFYIGSSPSATITLTDNVGQVRSGDLNDDGKDDLAISYSNLAKIDVWISTGSISFSNSFNLISGGVASGISISDFNGDRRADLLASSSTSRSISIWLQNDLAPVAQVWASSSKIDVNKVVSFDASNSTDSFSDRSSLTYYWDFGDGNTSTGKTAQNLYTRSGTYSGYLLITDRSGLTGRADFKIKVMGPLTASIHVSDPTPMAGTNVTITDISDAPNGIAYRSWDLGDNSIWGNSVVVTHAYDTPGNYTIKLTVVDKEGKTATASRTIFVLQASNTIKNLIANGGETSFNMDEIIPFEVLSKNSSLATVGCAWDMDYNETTGFNQTPGISINRTTWSYSVPGEHTICVRVYDIDPFTEEFLTIVVLNYRPVAEITASSDGPGNFTFDASNSWDSVSDISSLSYRWNFGDIDGWTDWANTAQVTKNYTIDGKYTVTLEVRDQWKFVGSTTYLAILDRGAPTIDLDQSTMVSHAYRGEDLVIKVNVIDLTGVEQVLLIYTSNNETKTLVMSLIGGTNTYVATIPAEDVTGDLSYYIDAVDGDNHHTVTSAMTINLTDRPNDFLMYVILAAVAALGAIFLIYYRSASMVVDEVFIIYEDGNMMAHQTRRLKPGMDDQVLSSMLVAIQNFVKDSFKDEASTGLNRMDFGEQKVLVEKGEHIYLAVVLHGKREGRVPQRMKEAIAKAESMYSQALEGWDGDLEKVRGIKDETNPLLKSSLKDFISAIPFIGRESAGPAEMTTCQFCFTSFPAGEPKCPKCGTVPDKKPPMEGPEETGGQAS